ncbi:MAG: 50S ribosomal protein L29 [Candidatus Woesearchaeota archaeon]
MTKFKIKNIEELGMEDCQKKLTELRLSLLRQRGQIAKGAQLENPRMVREIRKNIARIHLRIKELEKRDDKAPKKKESEKKVNKRKTGKKE